MSDMNPSMPVPPVVQAKTNVLAIVSAVCGMLSVFGLMIHATCSGILAPAAIIFGIIALVQISRSNGAEKGQVWAIAGLVLATIMIFITCIVVFVLTGTRVENAFSSINSGLMSP